MSDANDILRKEGVGALRDHFDKAPRIKLVHDEPQVAPAPQGEPVTEEQRAQQHAIAQAELGKQRGVYRKHIKDKSKTPLQHLKTCAAGIAPMIHGGWIEREVVENELRKVAKELTSERPPAIERFIREGLDTQGQPPPELLPEQSAPVVTVIAPQWIDVSEKGVILRTCANTRVAIERLGIQCRYDVFHDRKLVGGHVIEQWTGEVSDAACLMLRLLIRDRFGFDPGNDHTNDASNQLCLQHQFDPVCDYLDSLNWDGVPRLDKWLTTYLGAKSTPFVDKVGELMLVAAVRRARQPGCKFDQIPVFEGPEGTDKSSAIEVLAGKENFSDQTVLGRGDKEAQELIRGTWLYEIADLAGMKRAEVEHVKAFASRTTDRARPAYGRNQVDLARRGIFVGTTNFDTYLQSQTGNRRFWPVKTGQIDLIALTRDRDQLWAEAAAREASGMSIVLPRELWGDAAIEQDKRRDHDPWDDILAEVRGVRDGDIEKISSTDLLRNTLALPADRISDATAKRLAQCMKRLGWTKPDNMIRIDGRQVRGFTRTW